MSMGTYFPDGKAQVISRSTRFTLTGFEWNVRHNRVRIDVGLVDVILVCVSEEAQTQVVIVADRHRRDETQRLGETRHRRLRIARLQIQILDRRSVNRILIGVVADLDVVTLQLCDVITHKMV